MYAGLTPDKRQCAEQLYRKGLTTVDHIGPKVDAGLATLEEQQQFDRTIANIEKLWAQYGGDAPAASSDAPPAADTVGIDPQEMEKQREIEAFRAFRERGKAERIFSKKLNETIVLACDEQQRKEMDDLGTIKEPIYTVAEVIWLFKRDFSVDQLKSISELMRLYDGQIVKPRPIPDYVLV